MRFIEVAKRIEEVYGVYYDREEEFFICPECGEPIYIEDWVSAEFESQCPVCEFEWEINKKGA